MPFFTRYPLHFLPHYLLHPEFSCLPLVDFYPNILSYFIFYPVNVFPHTICNIVTTFFSLSLLYFPPPPLPCSFHSSLFHTRWDFPHLSPSPQYPLAFCFSHSICIMVTGKTHYSCYDILKPNLPLGLPYALQHSTGDSLSVQRPHDGRFKQLQHH